MIVKSVERNALNMYEARKCLLGLESSGVSIATSLSPASCPAGLACPSLDILASAGLGLTGLGIKFIITTGERLIGFPALFYHCAVSKFYFLL